VDFFNVRRERDVCSKSTHVEAELAGVAAELDGGGEGGGGHKDGGGSGHRGLERSGEERKRVFSEGRTCDPMRDRSG